MAHRSFGTLHVLPKRKIQKSHQHRCRFFPERGMPFLVVVFARGDDRSALSGESFSLTLGDHLVPYENLRPETAEDGDGFSTKSVLRVFAGSVAGSRSTRPRSVPHQNMPQWWRISSLGKFATRREASCFINIPSPSSGNFLRIISMIRRQPTITGGGGRGALENGCCTNPGTPREVEHSPILQEFDRSGRRMTH